jgi:hypothetical protein
MPRTSAAAFVAGQDRNAGQPRRERAAAAGSPVADIGPFGQLAEGHERDEGSGRAAWSRGAGELAAVQEERDVGVEDNRGRGGRSGQVAVAFAVSEGQEVVQFLIRLDVSAARSRAVTFTTPGNELPESARCGGKLAGTRAESRPGAFRTGGSQVLWPRCLGERPGDFFAYRNRTA